MPVRRWRCGECHHLATGEVPPTILADTRNQVAELATRKGIAAASRELECGSDAVAMHLGRWIDLRERDIPDEWPADTIFGPISIGGRSKLLIGDVDRALLVDICDADGLERWAATRHGHATNAWIPADGSVFRAVRSAQPHATVAVPSAWASKAIVVASEATFRVLRRLAPTRRNRREDVETFLARDDELDAETVEEVRTLWSVATRVLRRHHHALILALAHSTTAFETARTAAVEWLRLHARESRLLMVLLTWGTTMALGAGRSWPTKVAEDLQRTIAGIGRISPPIASLDVLRARIVLSSDPGIRTEPGRGRHLGDLAASLA